MDEWADHLILPVLLPVGGFNENKEEEKEQPENADKTTDDDKDDDDEEVMNVVFSSDTVVDSGFAASPIVVSYELSESECGSPTPGEVEERVLGNVESVVLANDNEAVDVAEEEGEDALESYLFTPPPVNLAKKDTLKEDAVEEEKNTNTQSARLSSSMWDVKMMHNMNFMKNVSAMDVAMGAGVAAVVFNFFMPSFLKACFEHPFVRLVEKMPALNKRIGGTITRLETERFMLCFIIAITITIITLVYDERTTTIRIIYFNLLNVIIFFILRSLSRRTSYYFRFHLPRSRLGVLLNRSFHHQQK